MDELSGPRTAAAVAPIIDRLRISIARALAELAPAVVEPFGIPATVGGTIAMLRHLDHRAITPAALDAVFRYQPPESVAAAIAASRAAGLVAEDPGAIRLTEAGRQLMAELLALTSEVVDARWSSEGARLARLLALTDQVLDAAVATGGESFAVLYPLALEPAAGPALVLAERLTALRFHRADAHAAAWQVAGLTAVEVAQLPPGPERDALEADTNERAGPPYAVLAVADRVALIADLGALSG
jgi:LmbE family N-acetylglucosaminyl deacetylase